MMVLLGNFLTVRSNNKSKHTVMDDRYSAEGAGLLNFGPQTAPQARLLQAPAVGGGMGHLHCISSITVYQRVSVNQNLKEIGAE